MSTRKCYQCGDDEMKRRPTTGPFPYKKYKAVTLNIPIDLYSCEKCGNLSLTVGDAIMIDNAIEEQLKTHPQNPDKE